MKRLLAITLIMTGCASAPASTVAPTQESLVARPAAEVVAEIQDSIGLLYCDTEPVAEWCDTLTINDAGKYDIALDGTWLYVGSSLGEGDLAGEMCSAIAAAHFDADAQPLGFTDVAIVGPGQNISVDCDIP